MIKLTSLDYKLKEEAIEKFHNINERNESLLFEWGRELEKATSMDMAYPEKPYIEIFEYKDADFLKKERRYRVRLEDIHSYKENEDDLVEIIDSKGEIYIIKEKIEFLDELFG